MSQLISIPDELKLQIVKDLKVANILRFCFSFRIF